MKGVIVGAGLLVGVAVSVTVLAGTRLFDAPYVIAISPLDVNAGGEYAVGGAYAVLGSVAQADGVGESTGGPYELAAGFLGGLPFIEASVLGSREWIYENDGARTRMRNVITFTATVEDDNNDSDSYTYNWISPEHPVTFLPLVLVSGGGPDDSTATYAAPQQPSAARAPYTATCQVIGQTEAGTETAETTSDGAVAVHLLGDANGDYAVTGVDFSIWKLQNGQAGPGLSADFNGDGRVTGLDFSLWKFNNGRRVP
jgi:hypothetical protein